MFHMNRSTVFLLSLFLLCLLALVAGLGCRSVYAEGSYPRLGSVRLSNLPSESRELIEAAVKAHTNPQARGRALWNQGRQFEQKDDFAAALASYQEIKRTGALPPVDLQERVRRCRARIAVAVRWKDEKLLASARGMKLERGLALYREVARTIADNYVDQVSYRRLLEGGLANLRAAMASPEFRRRLSLTDSETKQAEFLGGLDVIRRKLLEENRQTSFTARYYVRQVCQENQRTVALPCGVIISEMIFGAAEHLDDYTTFLTHEMYEELKSDIDGRFVGLGIEVRHQEGRIHIVGVFDGGPAGKAGLAAGDIIIAVEKERIDGKSLDEAARLIRGPKGSAVTVTVEREGKPLTFTAVRDTISVPSIRCVARIGRDNHIGYIHLAGFQRNTATEMSSALERLQRKGSLDGLVLDLRGNPGGLLEAAVGICNLFIKKGTAVTTRGRGFGQTRTYRVNHWRFSYHGLPLVALVDRRSASASEIVAGALHDHRRATLVGSRTFGKGIVQSILPVEAGQSAVYLTTARFFGPDERPFHGTGIAPDVAVDPPAKAVFARPVKPDPKADPVLKRALEVMADQLRQSAPVTDPSLAVVANQAP